jgi:hypothetical protein
MSQITTIEVFDKLINNIGTDIKNSQLSISSYTKNKNEMLGKIVMPLKKIIEQKY